MIKRYAGVSLLEALLVIAIGAGILFLSLQQYQSYQQDAQVLQLQANVDTIFQAMTGYYKQNCYGNTAVVPGTSGGPVQPGTLNPNATPTPKSPFYVDIANFLIKPGFLPLNEIPLNPMVDATGTTGWNGYVAQFNMANPTQRQICMAGTNAVLGPADPKCDVATTPIANIGSVTTWIAQVAVQLNNPTDDPNLAQAYLNLLGGDCLSNASGTTVTPCVSGSTGTGNYVVWTRLPFNANTKAPSGYWVTTPTVAQFKQMYTTYPILNLTNGTETPNQNYLCGN